MIESNDIKVIYNYASDAWSFKSFFKKNITTITKVLLTSFFFFFLF